MAEQLSPQGEAPSGDTLAVADYVVDCIRKVLLERLTDVKEGEPIAAQEALALTTELRKWAIHASEERNRLAKHLREIEGGGGSAEIDFDAARSQIGRRLARLRAARGAGSLPARSE